MNLTTLLLILGASSPPGACSCTATLDHIVDLTETNYAGYRIKLPDETARAVYDRFHELAQTDAASANAAQCPEIVRRYTEFFADHHLFAFPREGLPPALPAPARKWTPETARRHYGSAPRLTGIEGLWYDEKGQIVIAPDAALAANQLAAIGLDGERAGQVIALFSETAGGWRADYRTSEYGWQSADAALRRDGALLTFGLRGFGRSDVSHLDTVNPLAPYFEMLEEGVAYLSMPSFMPEHRNTLRALMAKHDAELKKARGMILDVRGNAGGDAIYFPLLDYYLANDITVSNDTKLLASPLTVAYFEKFRERLGAQGAWLDGALERMHAHPGEIVDYLSKSVDGLPAYPASPVPVVILQDNGVGSAAEAFIFHSAQSRNVTTMGEPTRGNIDYMQVSMHKAGCGDFEYWFGYPLYFKAGLPTHSIDDRGFAPDVRLSRDFDWLAYAQRWVTH